MMKNLLSIFLFLLLVSFHSSTVAQDTSKISEIRKLLEVSGSADLAVQMIDNMFEYYEKNLPDIDPVFWASFKKEINPNDFIKMLLPIYDKYYTSDDIRQLISFYESPIGRKMVSTLPQVMNESMKAGETWGQEIAERVMEKLEKEGQIK